MKPYDSRLQQQPLCINSKTGYDTYSSLPSSLAESSATQFSFIPALKSLWKKCALVAPDPHAILAQTKALALSATVNARIYVGFILVGIVAPLSACVHMLPGMRRLKDATAFYQYDYDLYLVLGPYFFSFCIMLFGFLMVPPVTRRIKFSKKHISVQLTRLFSLPAGLIIGKIVWLIFCTSNEDFDRILPWHFALGGLAIGYVFIRSIEYLIWRQEHVMNALIDSLQGLYDIKGMDEDTRRQMAAPYWKELREFNSKY